jgi:hypothetical protein
MLYCPICLHDIDNGLFVTLCDHVFHKTCMKICLVSHSTCPMCRRPINIKKYKNSLRVRKIDSIGYKWTELMDMEGKVVSSFPLWI